MGASRCAIEKGCERKGKKRKWASVCVHPLSLSGLTFEQHDTTNHFPLCVCEWKKKECVEVHTTTHTRRTQVVVRARAVHQGVCSLAVVHGWSHTKHAMCVWREACHLCVCGR